MKNQVNGYGGRLRSGIEKAKQKIHHPMSDKFYNKLVDKGLLLLLKYKSSISNGTYIFTANLELLAKAMIDRKYPLTP